MPDFVDRYLEHLKVSRFAEETIYNHRRNIGIFLGFLAEHDLQDLRTVTRTQVSQFKADLFYKKDRKGKPYNPNTQNKVLRSVRGFYRWLYAEDLVAADPCKELVYAREPKTLPAAPPTTAETKRLLLGTDMESLLGIRDRLALEIAYGSGLRAGEIRRLKVDDLDLGAMTLRVNQGKYRKDRVVPLTHPCAQVARRYLKEVRGRLIVGKPDSGHLLVSLRKSSLGRSGVGLIVKRAAKAAGLTRRVFPHALRAACLTHMLRNSKQVGQNIMRPLMEMAGHADLTTLHRYTATDIQELKEIHAKTHPRELEPPA